MQLDNLNPFITWLHMHPHWGGIIAFLISFAESLAILGLIIPGSIAMSAIGILVGSHVLPLATTMIWAMMGAFLGDVSSYWFGHHYRSKIHNMWPFSKMPSWLDRGESFFASHGGKGVFIGRFIGPIRPILPLIAGTMRMPASRFHIVDFLSAILWAPVYMLPGILIGAASLELPPEVAKRLIIYLVVIFIILGLLFWLIKKIFHLVSQATSRLFLHTWQTIINKSNGAGFSLFFQTKPDPNNPRQLIIATFFILSFVSFIVVTIYASQMSAIAPFNLAIFNFFRSIYHPSIQHAMVIITTYFSSPVMGAIALVILIYLLWRQEKTAGIFWLLLNCFAFGFAGFFKDAIHSPRPLGLIHSPHSWSYPSGHVTLSTAILSFLIVLIGYQRSRFFYWVAFGVVGSLILLCCWSRLYLGVHWASDVIGAVLLGATLALGATFFYHRKLRSTLPIVPMLTITLLTVVISGSLLLWKDYTRLVYDYTPLRPFITTTIAKWWQSGLNGHPLYRINRFGKPVQTMNIEWLGNLNTIKQTLINQGWQIKPNNDWISTINYLGVKDHSKMLPLFPVANEGRKPILTMTILVGHPRKLLILRLWPSNVAIAGAVEKIWIGTLSYQRHDKKLNSFNYPFFLNPIPAPNILSYYLQGFRYKTLYFPEYPPIDKHRDSDWDGRVLLISPEFF